MVIKKITIGFVIQEYDTETRGIRSQEFIAGDQVDFEDEEGNALNPLDCTDLYYPFEMKEIK